jgi:hypothetical protein
MYKPGSSFGEGFCKKVDVGVFFICLILRFPAKEFTRFQVQETFSDPEHGSRNFFRNMRKDQ